jgi:hypothetical protein
MHIIQKLSSYKTQKLSLIINILYNQWGKQNLALFNKMYSLAHTCTKECKNSVQHLNGTKFWLLYKICTSSILQGSDISSMLHFKTCTSTHPVTVASIQHMVPATVANQDPLIATIATLQAFSSHKHIPWLLLPYITWFQLDLPKTTTVIRNKFPMHSISKHKFMDETLYQGTVLCPNAFCLSAQSIIQPWPWCFQALAW